MKKYLTSLNIVFAVEVSVVALASLGIIPRESVLFLTGLMIFYIIFSPSNDALYLLIMSIPVFAALPLFDDFDSMANWRILIAVLFLCLFFKNRFFINLIKKPVKKTSFKEILRNHRMEMLVLAFFLIAALSIFAAGYKLIAVKKLLFLINAFLLFLIVKNSARNKEIILKIWQASALAGGLVIGVALAQLIVVLFVPLYTFWQFWASKIISALYGQNLAYLLSYSNTWFAYFSGNQPPVLRLFSVFPDSHSLAMFLIFMEPVFLGLAVLFNAERKKKIFYLALAILSLLLVVLTGSRGAWLSFIPAFAVALFLFWRRIELFLTKKAVLVLSAFIVLFLASTFYPPVLYKFQSWQSGQSQEFSNEAFSFFKRAKSISDISETSNKGRLEIWRASAKSIITHPVLGVGLGNYVTVLDEDISFAKKGASAHNLYLDFAAEIGVPGALILIAIFIGVLGAAWVVFRRSKEAHFKIFGLLFGIYFLWILGYSLFDVVLLNDKVLLLFMVELGMIFSLKNLVPGSEN